jgi:DNA-binding response OmpR family regulator
MASANKPDVVIVEDDPNQRKILELVLASEGFSVEIATNGEEGASLVRRSLPSVVVTDVMLPSMDGFEMCRRLRRDPMTADIPIIFVTALGSVKDKRTGFDLGADAYLTKPYSAAELVAHIRSVLRRSTGPVRRPRVLLSGQLAAASIVDVLQTIGFNGISGILEVSGSDQGRMELHQGRLLHAQVTTPRREILGLKAWYRMVTWNEGFFELRDPMEESAPGGSGSIQGMPLQSLLLEAAYYRDEHERLRTMFPGLDVSLLRTGLLEPDAPLNQRRVWETVGESIEVAALLDELLEFTDLEILQSAFRLMERGLLVATLSFGR